VSVRVFAARPDAGAPALLDADESHYLRRVRRVADGTEVELIDDHGGLWRARVVGGDARRSELILLDPVPVPAPARELVLLLGLPEPAAVLDLLPGVIELGVAAIAWVRCARSQGGPPGPTRVQKVFRAAQRQCGRPAPPLLLGEFDLAAAAGVRPELPGFFAWEQRRGRADDLALAGGGRLLVGPEGGLTTDEAESLRAGAMAPLGLGPHTLRTGTAALVGLARLMFAPRPAN
jgi:16S rRNA (uracil1498-N3)-methyltransferase